MSPRSLKGHLLVARSHLLDPNFARTVLLMFEHNEQGAAGVVLNRPTDATIAEVSERIFPEALDWDKTIHLGGPVPGPLLAIHQEEPLSDHAITDELFQTVDSEKLHQLLMSQTEPSLIVANYAGWGPGQLEREIAEDSWVWLPARPELVFYQGEREHWRAVLTEIGGRTLGAMLDLKNMPADPGLN